MNGPAPTGCSAKSCDFSSSVAPFAASNSFLGMIAALNVASAAGRLGSGCFSLNTTVSAPCPATELIDASKKFQIPAFGSRARFSDQTTSSVVTGLPSENLMPGRSLTVNVLPSSEACHSVASPGFTPCPSGSGTSRPLYRLVTTQMSTLASFSTGSRNWESALRANLRVPAARACVAEVAPTPRARPAVTSVRNNCARILAPLTFRWSRR